MSSVVVMDVMTVTFSRAFRHLTFSTGNRWLLQSIYCSYNKTCSVLRFMILFVNPVFKPELKILHTLGSHLFEHNNLFFHKYITYWKSFKFLRKHVNEHEILSNITLRHKLQRTPVFCKNKHARQYIADLLL
jgi:hypothetical protein